MENYSDIQKMRHLMSVLFNNEPILDSYGPKNTDTYNRAHAHWGNAVDTVESIRQRYRKRGKTLLREEAVLMNRIYRRYKNLENGSI